MKKNLLIIISLVIFLGIISSILTTNLFAGSSIIRNEENPGKYSGNGPYSYKTYSIPKTSVSNATTVYYPTGSNAQAPFSGIVYCPPYTGRQYMLASWGPFFASHGIILVTFDTKSTMDSVDSRASQQRDVLNALKKENTRSGSPLYGKVAVDRLGAMGWSMGGGASWINSAEYEGLATAMTLAGHNMSAANRSSKGYNTKCPTLIMNGARDTTFLGGMGQSSGVFKNIPNGIPKVLYEVASAGHMNWTSPTSADKSVAQIALAFQKTYLDGDTRWAEFISKPSSNVSTWKIENVNN